MSGPPAWAGDGLHGRLGLADDRHCLALLDGIGHPVDGAHNSRTGPELGVQILDLQEDRKSTRLNSSHQIISYAVFCLKKKKKKQYNRKTADRMIGQKDRIVSAWND